MVLEAEAGGVEGVEVRWLPEKIFQMRVALPDACLVLDSKGFKEPAEEMCPLWF